MNTKPNRTSFKKGNPGGPGRKKLPPEIRELSAQTKPAIIEAYFYLSTMSIDRVQTYKPKTMLEAGIMKCLLDFMRTGRTAEISRIWAECHGRPKESVELEIPNIPVSITINGIAPTTDPADSH